MKSYRIAFWVTLATALALAISLGWTWRHFRAGGAPVRSSTGGTSAASSGTGAPEPQAAAAQPELAPIQLSPERLQSIGVTFGVVARKPVSDRIRVTGNVAVAENRLAYVQVRYAGWIRRVFAGATFQHVRPGQPLFTIYSPAIVTTERDYLLAKQNARLLASSSVDGVASGAASIVSAARDRLRQWQIPESEIARLDSTGQASGELEVDSPVSGWILDREALPNLYVEPGTKLYTVADLSTVWVFAQVFQSDLGRVRPGDPASLTVDSYPGRSFRGRIDFLYPQIDEATRTARVRLVFSNPGLVLKPGMYTDVELEVPLGRQLVAPASGVFQAGLRNIVFLDRGNGTLEPREVTLGPAVGENVIVLKGLGPGDRIVTSANFLIDSESQLQAALGSFMPPPPGASQQALSQQAQATIEFQSEPSPPRKGANTFLVKVTGAGGGGIAGARVTATFYMEAMPQMGMPAMRVAVELQDKGGGTYQGEGNLPSGGTWQVTILAQRSGQTIAARQLTVTVEGGR